MAAGDVRAGGAFVELGLNVTGFQEGIQQAAAMVTSFGQRVASVGARIGASAAIVSAPIAQATRAFTSTADDIRKNRIKSIFDLEDDEHTLSRIRGLLLEIGAAPTEAMVDAANTTRDAIRISREAFRTLSATVGAALSESLINTAAAMTAIFQVLQDVARENPGVIQGFARFAAILGGVGTALVAMGGAIAGVGSILGTLATIAPFAAMAAGITAAGAAFLAFTGDAEGAMGFLGELFRDTIDQLRENLESGDIVGAFTTIANAVGSIFVELWNQISATIAEVWGNATENSNTFLGALLTGFQQVGQDIIGTFSLIGQAIAQGDFVAAFEIAALTIQQRWEQFKNFFVDLWVEIKDGVLGVMQSMLNGILDGHIWLFNKLSEMAGAGNVFGLDDTFRKMAEEFEDARDQWQFSEGLAEERNRVDAEQQEMMNQIEDRLRELRQRISEGGESVFEGLGDAAFKSLEVTMARFRAALPEIGAARRTPRDTEQGIAARGTFSALEAAQFGAGVSVDMDILAESKEHTKLLKDIERKEPCCMRFA